MFDLKYIPSNVKTVVLVNDFDYVEGGASKVAMMTAEILIRAGYDTYLFSAVTKKDEPKIAGLKYVSTNQFSSLSDPNKLRGALNGLYNFKAAKKFKSLLKSLDSKTTLVHVHTWTKALSSCIWNVAYSLQIPVYLTCHDYFSVCPNGGFFDYKKTMICNRNPLSVKCMLCNCDSRNYAVKLYRFLRTFVQNKIVNIFKKTTKFISISDFSEGVLKRHFACNVKFERVNNPVDCMEKWERIRPERNELFLFVGRLSKEKGCDLFCNAIKDLGLRGLVVGDGPEYEYLKTEFGKSNIEFVGWKSRSAVFEYMKKSRALVFPSRWYEAAPLTVPEALSMGLPCIVSGCCAARDYIKNDQDGRIFESFDELKRIIKDFSS